MRKETVVLNPTGVEKELVNGLDLNTNLKEFRKQLDKLGYTEINTYKRDGKQVVEFVTTKKTRLELIDAGLIKGSKEERQAYYEATKSPLLKKTNFGYAW